MDNRENVSELNKEAAINFVKLIDTLRNILFDKNKTHELTESSLATATNFIIASNAIYKETVMLWDEALEDIEYYIKVIRVQCAIIFSLILALGISIWTIWSLYK